MNVDHTIHTEGLIFDYEYALSRNDKLHLNYYTSTLSETINNSTKGGYIKYMGSYQKWDYFTSLIYKNAYRYETIRVPASYNVSLGATYHLTKDLSYSVKVNNILDKSTRSLYQENVNGSFTLEDDNDRNIFFAAMDFLMKHVILISLLAIFTYADNYTFLVKPYQRDRVGGKNYCRNCRFLFR